MDYRLTYYDYKDPAHNEAGTDGNETYEFEESSDNDAKQEVRYFCGKERLALKLIALPNRVVEL